MRSEILEPDLESPPPPQLQAYDTLPLYRFGIPYLPGVVQMRIRLPIFYHLLHPVQQKHLDAVYVSHSDPAETSSQRCLRPSWDVEAFSAPRVDEDWRTDVDREAWV